MREMPTMGSTSYASQAVNLANYQGAMNAINQQGWPVNGGGMLALQNASGTATLKEPTMSNVRRLVQVFIADPNENVPLDQSLLYSGEQKFTDATDQELFFEIDINTILKAYNDKRVKVVDKKVKERTEYLEAAKIRDLKMVVVTVAGF